MPSVAQQGGDGGGPPRAAKLRLYLKIKNREDVKKGRQKIGGGVKSNLGRDKKF